MNVTRVFNTSQERSSLLHGLRLQVLLINISVLVANNFFLGYISRGGIIALKGNIMKNAFLYLNVFVVAREFA